ncbi:hypothetical protein [Kiloniella antarctica]|uniref:Uncharacterized protein n=1 Tax=Kiloniella antarctica TaxID=1550907 RepID=A0ABW5BMU8_9PROT
MPTSSASPNQQRTIPTSENDVQNTENKTVLRTPSFFKRLYTSLYIEALFFVLVQINGVRAATETNDEFNAKTVSLNVEEELQDITAISTPDIEISTEITNDSGSSLSLDDFIDPTEPPLTIIPVAEEAKNLFLLDNIVSHDNFKLLDTSKLQNETTTRLTKYTEDTGLNIFGTENSIIIELDDDDLLYSDEDLALFGVDDYHFLVVNNDLLDIFTNNTQKNSWESLKPGEEYFILRQEDILEDDVEIITIDEEIYLDEAHLVKETVSVDYFVYKDTVIGMAFTLPEDFYQSHGPIDFDILFA